LRFPPINSMLAAQEALAETFLAAREVRQPLASRPSAAQHFALSCIRAPSDLPWQEECISPLVTETRPSPCTGGTSSNRKRVSFSEEVFVRSYLVEERQDDEKESCSTEDSEPEPVPCDAAEPMRAAGKKRGRPADTPLQKAEKAMDRADIQSSARRTPSVRCSRSATSSSVARFGTRPASLSVPSSAFSTTRTRS
jgi:hypothetical protein